MKLAGRGRRRPAPSPKAHLASTGCSTADFGLSGGQVDKHLYVQAHICFAVSRDSLANALDETSWTASGASVRARVEIYFTKAHFAHAIPKAISNLPTCRPHRS